MNYILDTNIVLIYTRESPLTKIIENKYNLFNSKNKLYLSVVTIAELKSLICKRPSKYRFIKRHRFQPLGAGCGASTV